MTPLISILNLNAEELKAKFVEAGIEPYRADQVLNWIYEKGVYEFDRMTNLSSELRQGLKKNFEIKFPQVTARQNSNDESTKLLLKLNDKDYVEAVCMSAKKAEPLGLSGKSTRDKKKSPPQTVRTTVCISSQVGCKFHCAFCASGQDGFLRNLNAGEILAQVLLARDASPTKKINNIVFMGIGEPFDNYAQVLKAVRMLNSKSALNLGARKITISTCGVIPKIEALSKEGLQIELSVSLHGANDAVRGSIMPVNRAHPVKELIVACKQYAKSTKRAITFEYILIKGVNAGPRDAADLAKLLKGMLCKVNLIPYNPIAEFPHTAPSYAEIVNFQRILQQVGIKTTVRFSKGQDIQAACGQLRSVQLKK